MANKNQAPSSTGTSGQNQAEVVFPSGESKQDG